MSSTVHAIAHRSWWDGHVEAMCGARFEGREGKETWIKGGITCPGCKQAMKARRKKR